MESDNFTYRGYSIRKLKKKTTYNLSWVASLYKKDGLLKSCFATEDKAYSVFCMDICRMKEKIISDGGLLFKTYNKDHNRKNEELNEKCIRFAVSNDIPVTILFCSDNIYMEFESLRYLSPFISVGFEYNVELNERPFFLKGVYELLNHLGMRSFIILEPSSIDNSQSFLSKVLPFLNDIFIFVSPRSFRVKSEREYIAKNISEIRNLACHYIKNGSCSLIMCPEWDALIHADTPHPHIEKNTCEEDLDKDNSCHDDEKKKEFTDKNAKSSCSRISGRFATPFMMSSVMTNNVEVLSPPLMDENMFHEFVKRKVECRLRNFTKQENFFVAFAPLIIGELAWEYAYRALELSARYKVSVLKKLSRTVKGLRDAYLRELRKDLNAKGISRIKEYAELLLSEFSQNFMILYLSVDSDVQSMMPDCKFRDMRTDALCSFIILELLTIYNVKVDSMSVQRIGEHDGFRNRMLDALSSSMEAFIYPDSFKFSENSLMASKVIFNKIYEKTFSWCNDD